MTAAQPTLQIDNDRVRVTEWRFAPGTETGWHTHEMDYVVVPLYDGTLRIETTDGVTEVELRHGVSYVRQGGAQHNVISTTPSEFAFVEIELKNGSSPAPL
ncbi:MAG TPA: cupin domain-containing protein [Ilumatobacteraceae bacterium]|nr:cupin domain-containing protein [Ilumatobacteraceae bacterium]